MYTKSIASAFAATLFASANAHFFIKNPVPIPGNAIKDPLDPSGSNFPCHGADTSQGTSTPLTAGSTFNLEYELGGGANTAVHGGGSCQISICYETDPAKQKDPGNWKVIQSFVGGCPTNAKGNLVTAAMCDGSNAPECVNALSFNVPQEVQSGDAILAWTWFNNVGNREFYMNCAKVSISGGSGDISSLPGMTVANLASVNSCKSSENFNVEFADPGKYVTTESPLNFPTKALVGSGCNGSGGSSGGSTGGPTGGSTGGSTPSNGGSGSTPSSVTSPNTPTTTANNGQYTAAPVPSSGNGGSGNAGSGNGGSGSPGGIFAPGAGGAPTTLVTSAVPVATSSPSTGGSTGGSAPATGGSQGSCLSGQVSCTAEGFYCISSTQFGMCAFGCATPMDMAAGTECSAGVVKAIALPPQRRSRTKRHHLHARAHHVSPLL